MFVTFQLLALLALLLLYLDVKQGRVWTVRPVSKRRYFHPKASVPLWYWTQTTLVTASIAVALILPLARLFTSKIDQQVDSQILTIGIPILTVYVIHGCIARVSQKLAREFGSHGPEIQRLHLDRKDNDKTD